MHLKLENNKKDLNKKTEKMKKEYFDKMKQLYKTVEDRNYTISNLESKIDDYMSTLKDVKDNKDTEENYNLITVNNALRGNLKRAHRDLKKLQLKREDLDRLINLISFDKSENSFYKDYITKFLDPNYNINKSSIYQRNLHKNIQKVKKIMKISGIRLKDLEKMD